MKTEEQFDDSLWISQFQRGDEAALKQVYELYAGSLFAYAKGIVISEEEAKDIVAESFIKLWERSSLFKGIRNIKAFLYVITRNACFNHIRKVKRINTSHQELHYLTDTKTESIVHKIISDEVMKLFRREIDKLPDIAKRVFKMYVDGHDTIEIAERLGMPAVNVRNNKKRALAMLKLSLLDK